MKIFTCFAFSILLLACGGTKNNNQATGDANPAFDQYKNSFIEEFWKLYPSMAVSQGYHFYDSGLIAPTNYFIHGQVLFAKANLDSLKKYKLEELSTNNKTDYYLLQNQLESIVWGIEVLKDFEWNPSNYNVSGTFAEILNGTYDSLDNRLHSFYLRMERVPEFYEAAKQNIKNPTLEHTQLGIEQNTGGISVFENDLKDALKKSHLPEIEKKAMISRSDTTVQAIRSYIDFLKSLKNETPRGFRLGKDLYSKKFELDLQPGYSIDQIYQKAIDHKNELHNEMYKLAEQLWPKYLGKQKRSTDSLIFIKQVIDAISTDHVQPDSFQSAIEQQMPVLVEFIKNKNLIYLDPSKPLVVRREPDYMAGIAGASISAPGPYDKNGNTYYNVGSLSGWDKTTAESYLREYNKYILQILNIHEAIPGHYTQLIYSNQSPSLVKSIFGSSSMVEGWAVYAERMMVENGYGDNAPEMWLMYYKWNLRSTCNTILDYSVHAKDMSKEDALKLLVYEGFQQQTEAENKWKRVCRTQVQLCCYFTGYTEIYDFREEMKKKLGDKFNLKEFHEKFLSYGSAPVKYIRQLMLDELEKK